MCGEARFNAIETDEHDNDVDDLLELMASQPEKAGLLNALQSTLSVSQVPATQYAAGGSEVYYTIPSYCEVITDLYDRRPNRMHAPIQGGR